MYNKDEIYMSKALSLSLKGRGSVNPNPLVGAIVVKNGQIIGEGYHQKFGGKHAEINAFESLTESAEGAVMYVTLEPCSHFGKTPPCVQAIVKNKISKVFVGLLDPNPLVSGRGIRFLEEHGVEVVCGVLEKELQNVNRIFLKYITTKTPWVVMKTAMTLDGKIASCTGDSKWISCEESRLKVHKLRNELMGIMVGVETVKKDNPLLTTRLEQEEVHNPIRIVADSKASIPLDSRVLNTTGRTIVFVTDVAEKHKIKAIEDKGKEVYIVRSHKGRIDLHSALSKLGDLEIDSLLLEGGGTINFSAIQEGIVDEVYSYIAPKIIGGSISKTPVEGCGFDMMNKAVQLQQVSYEKIGDDLLIHGYIHKEKDICLQE
ncbi:MAG: bifunctional diaminohydroxyphosphoribosylaminopyrimidine deaminase/5-amino-6-(5-phosphoribosylamino)uracil reductase RibD [Bacteroidales bacterium]